MDDYKETKQFSLNIQEDLFHNAPSIMFRTALFTARRYCECIILRLDNVIALFNMEICTFMHSIRAIFACLKQPSIAQSQEHSIAKQRYEDTKNTADLGLKKTALYIERLIGVQVKIYDILNS